MDLFWTLPLLQVRAGFAQAVIPEDEISRLQLVHTFGLRRTSAPMMHTRLEVLKKCVTSHPSPLMYTTCACVRACVCVFLCLCCR